MNVTNNTIPSIIASFKLCLFSLLAICFINLYFIIKNLVKHKKLVKTMSEAEHEARIDPEYKKIVEQYAEAEEQLTKKRFHYNNIDRYVSLKQSELKRDLALNNKV